MEVWQDWSLETVAKRIRDCCPDKFGGILIGISGPPAAGKSSLAEDLCELLNANAAQQTAQLCPMDGFHLSNAKLQRLDLERFKGRIDTFDVDGYVSHLQRLRRGERNFYWPIYSRERHDVIPEGIFITPTNRIFITEGNYLLVGTGRWGELPSLLDLKVFVEADERTMIARLRSRHIEGGKTLEQADIKIAETDLPNARLVAQMRNAADIILLHRKVGDFERYRRETTERSPVDREHRQWA